MATKEELEQQLAEAQQEITRLQAEAQNGPSDTDAMAAARKADPSNTYEYGVAGNVDRAVPADAHLVTDFDEADELGYFGYAAGEQVDQTLQTVAPRNQRVREARRAVVNRSAADEDGHTADVRTVTRA